MFQIEADKPKNLLKVVFAGRVTAEETHRWREKLAAFVADMQPGFRLLIDLTDLESMDLDCAGDIKWAMELHSKAGVSKVVRIIPDPSKDIGLSIMSLFHYRRGVLIVTSQTMAEALEDLEL